MAQVGMLETDAGVLRNGDGKGVLLAILMTLIAGGLLPIFSFYSRPSTWGIWMAICGLIVIFSRELPLRILIKPVMPYFLWLLCFILWGLIVSPIPAFPLAIKAAVTTLIIAIAMAIITSKLIYLKVFANAMQWLVFCNVLLLPLMAYSPKLNRSITIAAMSGGNYEPGISRFAGFWDNPNMAGYMCLVAIVLSVWATPLSGWIGRLGSLPIIYYGASRKSMLLLMLFILLNIAIVQRHNLKRLFVWAMTLLVLTSLFFLSDGLLRKAQTRVAGDSNLTRLFDVTESNKSQQGGETRVDLLQDWLHVAANEPWYGYGFGAMAGRFDSSGRVLSYRLPTVGSHNTYIGVYIEAGILGLIAFLLILAYYTKKYFLFRGRNTIRWALLSFLACNLIILIVSHSHLLAFEGKIAYALFFLLPTCPALRDYGFAE